MHNLIEYFEFSHLPPHLQKISKPFSELANFMMIALNNDSESTTMMRKLLEAKDCAVRSAVRSGKSK